MDRQGCAVKSTAPIDKTSNYQKCMELQGTASPSSTRLEPGILP